MKQIVYILITISVDIYFSFDFNHQKWIDKNESFLIKLFDASKRKSSAKIQMDSYPLIKSDLNMPSGFRYEGKCWIRM